MEITAATAILVGWNGARVNVGNRNSLGSPQTFLRTSGYLDNEPRDIPANAVTYAIDGQWWRLQKL